MIVLVVLNKSMKRCLKNEKIERLIKNKLVFLNTFKLNVSHGTRVAGGILPQGGMS